MSGSSNTVRKAPIVMPFVAVALLAGLAVADTGSAQTQGSSLGRVGNACLRSLEAASHHVASGETRVAGFPITWQAPPDRASARQLCGCAQQAFRNSAPAQTNVLDITLFGSNRGELFTTNILMRRVSMPGERFGGGVGYHNAGQESAAVRRAYGRFAANLTQCGRNAYGQGYSNDIFLSVPSLIDVEVTDGTRF